MRVSGWCKPTCQHSANQLYVFWETSLRKKGKLVTKDKYILARGSAYVGRRANILSQEKNICNGSYVRKTMAYLKNTGNYLVMLKHNVEIGKW